MQTMTVKTGFGYFRDAQGHIISKAELPPGDHPLRDGFTYTELENQASLDALEIWQDPAVMERQTNEAKISVKIRADAIADLIVKGELPAGYE